MTRGLHRLLAPVVVAGLSLGGFAYFAAERVWATATIQAVGLPTDVVSVTGAEALPVVGAASLVVASASIALLATRGVFRRLVGGLMMASAIVGGASAIRNGDAVTAAVAAAVNDSPAFTGENSPATIVTTMWPVLAAVALLSASAVGLLAIGASATWPAMGRKYDAPSSRSPEANAEDEAEIWKALDEGRDPTQ